LECLNLIALAVAAQKSHVPKLGTWLYIAHPDEILNNSSSNGNENRGSINEENVNDPTAPMNGGKRNRKKSRKSKKQKKSRRVRK
jgi:hypothetical protein